MDPVLSVRVSHASARLRFPLTTALGPTLVSPSLIPDPSKLRIRGSKNGQVLQNCPLEYDQPKHIANAASPLTTL